VRAGGALAGARGRLDGRAAQTATLARSRMVAGGARLDAATRRLDASRLDARLAAAEARVTAAGTRVGRAASQVAATADATVDVAAARVGAADPARALARGWSLTRTAGGCLVRRAGQLQPGDDLVTTFADGEARSTVTARTTTTSGES